MTIGSPIDLWRTVISISQRFLTNPSVVIGTDYLWRWHLVPRNRFFNVYLHKFGRSDDDRALHDHPWYSVSFLLRGELLEHHLNGKRHVPLFRPVFRTAKFAHRLEVVKGPVWTLFVTGPKVRDWGFYCPAGWRHWRIFTSSDGVSVDRGCD